MINYSLQEFVKLWNSTYNASLFNGSYSLKLELQGQKLNYKMLIHRVFKSKSILSVECTKAGITPFLSHVDLIEANLICAYFSDSKRQCDMRRMLSYQPL